MWAPGVKQEALRSNNMQGVKGKKFTYLLIGAVGVVWGVIVYKVFFNSSGDEYQLKTNSAPIKHEAYDQYVLAKDTFKLALNYRDPFLGTMEAAPLIVKKEFQAIQVNVPPRPIKAMIDWNSIKYSGYIINPLTKTPVSIVTVRGVEKMMTVGEIFQEVKLIKNKKDSILVSWQGKEKYIKQ